MFTWCGRCVCGRCSNGGERGGVLSATEEKLGVVRVVALGPPKTTGSTRSGSKRLRPTQARPNAMGRCALWRGGVMLKKRPVFRGRKV